MVINLKVSSFPGPALPPPPPPPPNIPAPPVNPPPIPAPPTAPSMKRNINAQQQHESDTVIEKLPQQEIPAPKFKMKTINWNKIPSNKVSINLTKFKEK